MASKKKGKKGKKAARKERKLARKAAKRAKKQAKLAKPRAASKPAAARKAATRRPTRTAAKEAPPAAARRAVRRRRAAPAFKDRQQPESLRLRSAGPSFTADDLQRSLAFYRDVLGFTVKERWEQEGVLHGVELVAGSVSFWLAQDDWKKGRDRVKGQGFRIYCDTSQDIDALARRIEAAGVALLQEPKDQPWGGRDFAVADPDGFTITIASGV